MTTAIGFGVGFVFGGLTGSGSWDWDKAMQAARAAQLIGFGIGIASTGFGGTFAGAIVSGGVTGAGIGGLARSRAAKPSMGRPGSWAHLSAA